MKSLRFRKRVVESFEIHDRVEVYRTSQHHFDMIKSGIADGVSSSTGLFDDSEGPVPSIFTQRLDRFELADELMRSGLSRKESQRVASDGAQALEK
ncbi:MAG: hypothetical protein IKW36_05355 [Alistipes sp.]|nr:hypothetical protein [Alistipes sp.]